MSAIKIFEHPKFGEVRVITDASNELLFCANDVTDALGYSNGRKAVADHVEKDDVTKRDIIDSLGRAQSATFVTESGVYALVFGSKQERAKEFKNWVTKEVLPSIRKTGSYNINQPKSQQEKNQILTAKMKVASWVIKTLKMNEASKLAIVKSIADPLGLPTPDYVESKGAHLSAKDLLAKHEAGISTVKFNEVLVRLGYLTTVTRKAAGGKDKSFKVITDKGSTYGENMVSPHNQSETQPHWYIDKFGELLEIVKKAMNEGKEESHD